MNPAWPKDVPPVTRSQVRAMVQCLGEPNWGKNLDEVTAEQVLTSLYLAAGFDARGGFTEAQGEKSRWQLLKDLSDAIAEHELAVKAETYAHTEVMAARERIDEAQAALHNFTVRHP